MFQICPNQRHQVDAKKFGKRSNRWSLASHCDATWVPSVPFYGVQPVLSFFLRGTFVVTLVALGRCLSRCTSNSLRSAETWATERAKLGPPACNFAHPPDAALQYPEEGQREKPYRDREENQRDNNNKRTRGSEGRCPLSDKTNERKSTRKRVLTTKAKEGSVG